MLDFNRFAQLSSAQKEMVREKVHFLYISALDKVIPFDLQEFTQGELEIEDQQEADTLMIDFLNEQFSTIEDFVIALIKASLETESDANLGEWLQKLVEGDCKEWQELFPELNSEEIIQNILNSVSIDPNRGIDASVFTDDDSVQKAFFEVVISTLLEDQPNIYLRLQDGGITDPNDLVSDVIQGYQQDKPEHRLVIAELLNDFAQKGATFETIVAEKMFRDFLAQNPNPQSILDKLRIPPNKIGALLGLSELDANEVMEKSVTDLQNAKDGSNASLSRTPKGFIQLSFEQKDPDIESFLIRGEPSLVNLVKKMREARQKKMSLVDTIDEQTQKTAQKNTGDRITVLEDMGLFNPDGFHGVLSLQEIEESGTGLFPKDFLDKLQILINVGLIKRNVLDSALTLEIAFYESSKETELPQTEGRVLPFLKRK